MPIDILKSTFNLNRLLIGILKKRGQKSKVVPRQARPFSLTRPLTHKGAFLQQQINKLTKLVLDARCEIDERGIEVTCGSLLRARKS
jgi:hypothetical protein